MSVELDVDGENVSPVATLPVETDAKTAVDPAVIESAIEAIQETEKPSDETLTNRQISPSYPNSQIIDAVAKRVFPDPAYEGLMAALAQEEKTSARVREKNKLVEKYIAKIEKLLEVHTKLPHGDKVDLSSDIQQMLQRLDEEEGIPLWKKDEKTTDLSSHRISELKASISHHIDNFKTIKNYEITKLHQWVQDAIAFLEIAKGILLKDQKGKDTAIRNQRSSGG